MNAYGPTTHVSEGCTLCGACIELCNRGALALGRTRAELAHPDLCDGCCACEDVCPQGAIVCEFVIEWDERPDETPSAAHQGG